MKLSSLWNEDSQVMKEAEILGLTHVGWGKYADKQGNITHISEGGKLIPVEGMVNPRPWPKESPEARRARREREKNKQHDTNPMTGKPNWVKGPKYKSPTKDK